MPKASVSLKIPEIGFIAGTRAAFGAGLGLLLADKLNRGQRKKVGWILVMVGAYDCYCYLPLYIFCGEFLLSAQLRTAGIDAAKGALVDLKRVVKQIRSRWRKVPILVRGDSGFCRDAIMSWCEREGIDYVFGLAKNPRLLEEIKTELKKAEDESTKAGEVARVYKNFRYQTLGEDVEPQAAGDRQGRAHLSKRSQPAVRGHIAACKMVSGLQLCVRRCIARVGRWKIELRNSNWDYSPIAPVPQPCGPISYDSIFRLSLMC